MSTVQLSQRHSINMPTRLDPSDPSPLQECGECGKCGALCCGSLLMMSLTIGAVGAGILYLVFCVLALWNDKDLSDICSNSHLWYYLLVSIISFGVIKMNELSLFQGDNNRELGPIIIFGLTVTVIQVGFGIWGSLELFEITFDENNIHNMTVVTNNTDYHCKELAESRLFTMSFVSMILQFTSCGLVVIVLLCICTMPVWIT